MYRSTFSTFRVPAPDQAVGENADLNGLRFRQRVLLLASSVALLLAPPALVEPAAYWAADPELFRLLRGMAVVKGLLVLAALVAVWWRLGHALAPRLAAIYMAGVGALSLATGLIWELTLVPAASVLFHAATFILLLVAWRDMAPART